MDNNKRMYLLDLTNSEIGTVFTEQYFYLEEIQSCIGKNGTTRWYNAVITDKTATVCARLWREAEHTDTLEKISEMVNHVVCVNGMVAQYNGKMEIHISAMKVVPEGQYDLKDYIKTLSPKQTEELTEKLNNTIASVLDDSLRELLTSIFDGKKLELFCSLPANLSQHHCFNGGLLVWALEVADTATNIAEIHNRYAKYKDYAHIAPVDTDLVIAGALLAGIGKLSEYAPFPIRERKPRGRLIGYTQESFAVMTLFNNNLPKEIRLTSTAELANIILASSDSSGIPPQTKEAEIVKQATKLMEDIDSYDVESNKYDVRHPGNDETFITNNYLGHPMFRNW